MTDSTTDYPDNSDNLVYQDPLTILTAKIEQDYTLQEQQALDDHITAEDNIMAENPVTFHPKPFSTPPKNPFTSVLIHDSSEPNISKEEEVLESQYYNIQTLNGYPIQSKWFSQLQQAFQAQGIDPAIPTWVTESDHQISLLLYENPMQAGFKQVTHPWRGLFLQALGKLCCSLFGLKIETTQLVLPNGGKIQLNPQSWQDPQGRQSKVYQVIGLPDGTWLRLADTLQELFIPTTDPAALRKLLDKQFQELEASGKLRQPFKK